MKQYVVSAFLFLSVILLCVYNAKLKSQLEITDKQKKEIEYVSQKKARIYSEPNADSSELIKLMREGKL